MSSSLFSIMAQTGTTDGWNWLLIFIIFVVVLAVALIIQARFSTKEVDEFVHHEAAEHHEDGPESETESETEVEPQAQSVPEPEKESEDQSEPEIESESQAEPAGDEQDPES